MEQRIRAFVVVTAAMAFMVVSEGFALAGYRAS